MSGRERESTVVSRLQGDVPPVGIREAVEALAQLTAMARSRLRDLCVEGGVARPSQPPIVGVTPPAPARVSAALLDKRQLGAHALAYLAMELEACRQLAAWAERTG